MNLKNVLKSGVLYLCVIAVLYKNFVKVMEVGSHYKKSTQVWIPMVELKHGGSVSSSRGSSTVSGATHSTVTTMNISVPESQVDNISKAELGSLDHFGYPKHDPRIEGSLNWYQPKKVFVGYKHGKAVYAAPSIGSSGEIDRISLGRSRSMPANQPQWSDHTRSTESIFVPKADDARYY